MGVKSTKSILHPVHHLFKRKNDKFKMKFVLFLLFVLSFSSCKYFKKLKSFQSSDQDQHFLGTEKKSNELNIKHKMADDTGVTEEDKRSIISANNKFALDLYSYLNFENSNKNIFFSSYSIFTTMAMAYEGASGQTANEIQSVFYFPKNNNDRRSAIAQIHQRLNRPKKEYKLFTANALWIQEDLRSKPFGEIQKYYEAKVFIKTPVEQINQWIEFKTMNKFKDVVQDCNALCVYLGGNTWTVPPDNLIF